MAAEAGGSLRLRAETSEDLDVVSAAVQDALLAPGHCRLDSARKTFTAPIDRYCWERKPGLFGLGWRRPAALQFAHVLSARQRGLSASSDERYAVLLAVRFAPDAEPPGGVVSLTLAGGGEIALQVECLEALLMDTGEARRARARPDHQIGRLT